MMLKCQSRKTKGMKDHKNMAKTTATVVQSIIVQKSENYGVDHFVLLVHLAGIANTP